ncbi:hypothetical protein BHQ31_16250 [Burkholderia cenocepacia]|nr:hypothetical protein BHQ31_16250 [Burkholderia cenocepacia]
MRSRPVQRATQLPAENDVSTTGFHHALNRLDARSDKKLATIDLEIKKPGEELHGRIDAGALPSMLARVCALQLSSNFMARMPTNAHAQQLLCFYRGAFFVNPIALTDPELGQFDRQRMRDLLAAAGINESKLNATREFLDGFEDFDTAAKPQSQSRK